MIGAGAAGLCAAKHLIESGIDVTIYEIGTQIGGLWVYENDNGRSSAYRSLHINPEAQVSTFRGGSNIRMMDDQSKYVAAVATGRVKVPDAAGMQKAIQADHDWSAKQFPDSPRYGLELDPHRYWRLLARDYKNSKAA